MLLGRLTEEALKHDWIEYAAGVSMFLGAFALIGLITYKKKWTWLWKELPAARAGETKRVCAGGPKKAKKAAFRPRRARLSF